MAKWVQETYRKGVRMNNTHIKVGEVRLCVHRFIGYPPDVWLASSEGFFNNRMLPSADLEAAKVEALAELRAEVDKVVAALEGAGA